MDRKEAVREWNTILRDHPLFARTFLVQQGILMEAAELGYAVVDRSICDLLAAGLPVLFEDYWRERCKVVYRRVEVGGLIDCLTQSNRDPADCFGSDDLEGWFDDPFKDGRVLPPKPPIPPLS